MGEGLTLTLTLTLPGSIPTDSNPEPNLCLLVTTQHLTLTPSPDHNPNGISISEENDQVSNIVKPCRLYVNPDSEPSPTLALTLVLILTPNLIAGVLLCQV